MDMWTPGFSLLYTICPPCLWVPHLKMQGQL